MIFVRIALAAMLLAVPIAAVAPVTHAQQVASTLPAGLTELELEDPLEPVSLEPGVVSLSPAPSPPPGAPAVPDTSGAAPPGEVLPGDVATEAPSYPAASESVLVVKCRQLLVSDPLKAHRLSELLRAGASLDAAMKVLGWVELDDTTREYVVDELRPDVRAEVETLAAGGWSSVRPWRGRSSLFQVVSKGERQRGSVPALGQGLDPEEVERLAARESAAAPQPRPEAQASDIKPATVVQQATPQYPQGIEESAEVTVQVEVGLSDDYMSARIVRSTNPIFDQSALDAAQRSTYRSARRAGIPERGTLTLNFRFVAPGQAPPSMTPPDTLRGRD